MDSARRSRPFFSSSAAPYKPPAPPPARLVVFPNLHELSIVSGGGSGRKQRRPPWWRDARGSASGSTSGAPSSDTRGELHAAASSPVAPCYLDLVISRFYSAYGGCGGGCAGPSRTSTRPRRSCRSRGSTPRRTSRGTPASAWRTSTRPRPRAVRPATGASGVRSPARTATPVSSAPSSSRTSRLSPWSVTQSVYPVWCVSFPIDALYWCFFSGECRGARSECSCTLAASKVRFSDVWHSLSLDG